MGAKFGEIDVTQIIENEFRVSVMEKFLEWIINNNKVNMVRPSQEDVREIKKSVVSQMQDKYPKSGISFSEN